MHRRLWEPIHRRSRGSGPGCGKHLFAAEAASTGAGGGTARGT